ncbi:MAG: GTP pyrophosphokinase [Nitrospirae bacterium CG_4_10_14_3_um_filter_44_29]|nr:bifunctional (p)ppGpp synthetase/guanosine-3',5'-bis(diphosphate) 3'-pyrophosphohydrolase [Nitrospirota bacterium]OIO31542.1 MAG: GTP pyrophosphokinase [Nitrospirae bacterium CG1_02_44_142]PIP70121.1 MAG: GTP pyrophosphokinase [Nitrospirae bacterium CG22_combo_CG10-13_8_21_14_all_44_11]PIV40908.1 MAG: GTP pyrophosphokinase [Nitrospirae bacterium CG02_land_8_20_14_3_00_44_33]PIV66380.1 MAG: GTP pyrophosphokinase [Nitrospirae bacterium CG01_land_8_20_14_3_00_44_22]PIW88551.1 MAG: GTP pyrophos
MIEDVATIDDLIKKVLSYNPDADIELLRKTYIFSSEAHGSQKRMAGSPYIEHPLAVASILADMKMDTTTIAAGLLHDTIEDTNATVKDIKALFGNEIAFLVNALTKLSKMEFMTKEEAQAENFRKMLLAMAEDVRVILIKFADRLHNMKTLEHLPEEKRKRIAAETLDIYAPIANRLGIGWLKIEFEDLSFKFLMPEVYEEIVKKIAKRKEEQEVYLRDVVKEMEARLKEENIAGEASHRIKHSYGIYQKMQKQGITFEQIHDVLGIRIITDTKANCYAIMGLIHSLWTPVPGRFKDFIGVPKSNMYQSLHTTVIGPKGERVEFQIRTDEMHRIAEKGIASHWRYKERGMLTEKDSRYVTWLRDLVQSQKELSNARDFLEEVKGAVVPDVVYVFTPRGDIKELPSGSTPVDFAYSIHTDVGHKCVSAKVDGRIVPLRYQLKNGDAVEIITSPAHKPSRDWLQFVVTQRAKARIKQWINTEERMQGVELGIKLLESELKKHDMSNALMKSDEILQAAKSLGVSSLEELFVSVGFGKISPHQVVNKLRPEKPAEEVALKPIKPSAEQKGISIKGIDDILYHTAKCCYPVPGDSLVGFITRGKGVTIHNKKCHNLERLAVDNARLVDVEWRQDGDTRYPARLLVESVDKPGVLANLSALVSADDVNISQLQAISTPDQKAQITFIVEVKDKKQLAAIIQKIASMDGVLRVKR